ncbi:hypothetical protein BC830DRAFT_1121337 [Chytriomyces sp. MP71]|nr:hypothetical protein BC830DRAFT_1121337 [Chytriomyces sp. MP71]
MSWIRIMLPSLPVWPYCYGCHSGPQPSIGLVSTTSDMDSKHSLERELHHHSRLIDWSLLSNLVKSAASKVSRDFHHHCQFTRCTLVDTGSTFSDNLLDNTHD